jgi:hypothetical protein
MDQCWVYWDMVAAMKPLLSWPFEAEMSDELSLLCMTQDLSSISVAVLWGVVFWLRVDCIDWIIERRKYCRLTCWGASLTNFRII